MRKLLIERCVGSGRLCPAHLRGDFINGHIHDEYMDWNESHGTTVTVGFRHNLPTRSWVIRLIDAEKETL